MGESAQPMYTSFDEMPAEQRAMWKLASRIRLAREAAQRKDILTWGRNVFPHIFYLPYCLELHEYLILIRGLEFTMTKAPRNHAKTSVGDFLVPVFQSLEEPETFNYYLTVQGTEEKALALNRSIKNEMEGNEVIHALYGDQVGPRWTDAEFEIAKGVVFKGVSTGMSIRGLLYKNRRPDYIMPDDLYDEKDINNPESTIGKNNWFWGTLYPARAKTKRWAIHVTGTAINNYDLMRTMEKDSKTTEGNQIVCRTFKAIKDEKTQEVLWPELNTYASLMVDKVRMGSHIFMREMQNEPRDDQTAIIKRAWLYPESGQKDWEYDPHEALKFDTHHRLTGVILCVDPSIGEKMENDFTGCALIYRTRFDDSESENYYIHAVWNEQLSLDKRIKLLSDIAAAQPADQPITEVRIEAISGFKDFAREAERRTNLPIKLIEFVKDKISTLESKSAHFENKRIFLNRNIATHLKDELVNQLTNNHPAHDDIRDSILLGLDITPVSMKGIVSGQASLLKALGAM